MSEKPSPSLREVFLEAVEIEEASARAAFVKGACGDDRVLRRRVEELLAADEVGRGAEGLATDPGMPKAETAGTRVGRYKLLQQIGEGGWGVVFMAEQLEPVRRKVALKVIKLGMDTRQVVARFEAERQALALMEHPNIAKVLDAGSTDSGRPYFVMELMRGIKITDYCDQNHLDTDQRIQLFMQVCHGVQHAHQKGIIHRDLKPSNVLVTELEGVPLPKIIDFGIAKAVEGRLTDQTLFTAFEQFLGTPAYMSPEQAALTATDIDTRSDIYSLGVLLYELLTGNTPFDTKVLLASGLDEMRRTIQEVRPVRPSTRLRQTTAMSSAKPSAVARPTPLSSDLDWIVMKCLEKDRNRRYEAANALALDLRRHLDNLPVLARPPSRLYEFQKSVRRHKVGFTAAATVMLVLAAGVLFSAREAARARQAEHRARQRAYLADMRILGESLHQNIARARRLLEDYRPGQGEEDLRDFEWYYFDRVLSEDESKILGTHPGGAMTLLTEADGTFLTAGQASNWTAVAGQVRIWDGVRQKLKYSRIAPKRTPGIALSQDGKRLAMTHGLDIEIRSMDKPDQVQTTLTNWHHGRLYRGWGQFLSFFNHDTQLAIADWADSGWLPLTFVNIAGDSARQPLGEDQTGFRGMAISQDRLRLAIRDPDGRILILALPEGKTTSCIECPGGAYFGVYGAMMFLDNSDYLVTTSNTGQIDVWDVTATNCVRTIGRHGGFVSALALSPDGRQIASAGLDQVIKIWNPRVDGPPLRVLRGHRDRIFGVGFLPDNNTLVSCGGDGTVRQWDMGKQELTVDRWTLPPGQTYAAIHYGFLVATDELKQGQGWKVWDVSHFSEGGEPRLVSPPSSMKGAVVFPLPGTDYYLVWLRPNHADSRMSLYRGLDPPKLVPGFPDIVANDDCGIQMSKQLLMVYGQIQGEPHALVWDLARNRQLHLVKSGRRNFHAVAFASDGSFVIVGEGSRLGKLDLNTGIPDEWHDATPGMVSTITMLPDNHTIFAGGGLGVLRRLTFSPRHWDEVNGSPLQIHCMCLSPSGTRLATGDHLGNVKLWDVQTLREVAVLGTHAGRVTGLYFTPDGRSLLSTDAQQLRVWRTQGL